MKIAIMMRAIDQPTGFRTYMHGVVGTLLRIDKENEYLLLYRKPEFLGRFAGHDNVKEMLIGPSNVLLWDQVAVPRAARKEGVDVIFNPKFTVPLFTSIPSAMIVVEPIWWAWPAHHPWWDVAYNRIMLPLYCRKARHLLPWSAFMLTETRKYLKLPLREATVTYTSIQPHFKRTVAPSEIAELRARYDLPERYILNVADVMLKGYRRPIFSPTKNVEGVVRAFALCRDRLKHGLVLAGSSVREFLATRGITEPMLAGVQCLGFVPNELLPVLFAGADLFVMTPFYEVSMTVLIEAMTCGLPIVTSKIGACPEITDGAALLADPGDPADIADKMLAVLTDDRVRGELRQASLRRAEFFDWERTARSVLEGLRKAATSNHRPSGG